MMRTISKLTKGILTTAILLLAGIHSTPKLHAQELLEAAAVNCVPVPANLVSWWRAEGNANDTVGVHNGTPTGGLSFAIGEVGQAFSFNGTNAAVDLGNWFNLQTFSVGMWVKPGAAQLAFTDLIDNNHNDVFWRSWTVEYENTGLRFAWDLFITGGSYTRIPFDLKTNTWQYLVLTLDSNRLAQVYLDGQLQGSGTLSGAINYDGTQFLRLGRWGGGGRYFNGLMDEVDVYNRALSVSEIQALYNASAAGKCPPAPPGNCDPAPSGLVSWWQAEGNASDVLGTNNGTVVNGATFAPGNVGQAFSLNGVNQYISIPDSPSLRPTNLTIESWVKFSASPNGRVIALKTYGTGRLDSYALWFDVSGQLAGAVTTVNGEGPWLTYTWTPAPGTWHHVAYTFDNASSTQVLYVDGVAVASGAVSGPIAYDTRPFQIGADIENGVQSFFFGGLIDDVTLFNRALSASEIAAIYSAGASGKCTASYPPVITSQPSDRTVVAGDSATFSVAASGAQPLSYQWRLNGTNLDGATGSSFTLAHAQSADAGVYSALLSNAAGTVLSSNALLTVNPPPPCTAPPSDLVSWWQAEGNASDVLGTNNGTVVNGATFAPGRVGRAFSLNGVNQYISVPDSPSLRPTNLTVEGWVNFSTLAGEPRCLFQKPYGTAAADSFGVVFYAGQLIAAISRTSGDGPWLTYNWTPALGIWHHVAYTFDNASSTQVLYVDGVAVASGAVVGPIIYDTNPFLIGADTHHRALSFFFGGLIDDVALFNRALSASEIAAIYSAGASGKCIASYPPVITSQPADRTVVAGESATFSVAASGAQPLSYQWRLNGTNLDGATGTSFTLAHAQSADAGDYSALLSNSAGTVLSSNALLTVNPPPPCVTPPSGLVSWWRGEGDASDALGAHNGTASGGLSFASGEVGRAFSFNGVNAAVDLGNWFNLQTFSMAMWVKAGASQVAHADLIDNNHHDIGWHGWSVEYANTGLQFGWGFFCVGSRSAVVEFNLKTNTWQYLVLTLDSNRQAQVYLDGQLQGSTTLPGAISYDGTQFLRLGRWAVGGRYFNGLMDEVDVYNRALTVSEIQALYNASVAGKCQQAPSIITQPASQVAYAGSTATFTVTATGTAPLSYQWRFNGTNLDAATGSSLQLANVQLSNAGSYSVLVSNSVGTILSSNALLTVNPPPPCVTPPSGLVSWWRGEGDASDALGAHNGTASGGLSFASGEVGRAFSFNGVNAAVDLGNWFTLQTFSMAMWVKAGASQVAHADLIDNNHHDIGWHGWSVEYANTGLHFGWGFFCVGRTSGGVTFDLKTNTWQYLVLTLDSNRLAQVYLDGQLQGSTTLPGAISYDGTQFLRLGRWAVGGRYFNGLMDEVDVYNRALAVSEIQALYNASVAGKCAEPPFIIEQPQSQTVTENSTATFSVVAGGTPDLHYQWRFNGTNIPGATAVSLTLPNVQRTSAGLYSVRVANLFGSMTSSNALLTINRAPVAQVADVVTAAGSNCLADASINNGSYDPDGDSITLTQVPPGPYSPGTNLVTLMVADNRSGSNSASARVIVLDQTPPVLTCPANIVVTNAHDAATSMVAFSPNAWDNCSGVGTPVCTPPSGSAFGLGAHTVNVAVSDAAGNPSQGSFTVTVLPGNVAPVPVIEVSPLAAFPGYTNLMVLAPDGTNATVYFDGSKSYDLDDTNFLYSWSEGTHGFSTSVVATNVLSLGSHTITLQLDDTFPLGASSASVTVEVISPEEALGIVVALAEDSDLSQNRLQPLLATLNAIAASFDRDNLTAAINQLVAFQNKVLAQVAPGNPELAEALIQAAQQIINTLSSADGTPTAPAKVQSLDRQADGKLRMKFAAKAARVHLIQASSNLKDWTTIGVAHDNGDGMFDYEDPATATLPNRFYRILSP